MVTVFTVTTKDENMRSFDFDRIYSEFVSYYREREKGESEYYDWLRALKLDESKPYSQCQESFRWAKDMLRPLKEDEDNKYYQITVGFPVRSMNGNLYKERDLIAAALSLKGKHPSLNHKEEFWFRPGNRWGTLTTVDGKYEDGAVEAILQVPKTAVCPICNGAKMTELIDSKRIVNISLEGNCTGGQCVTGECEGFTFLDPPFTLLTSDVLPGIPLARIKPLEAVMVEALQASIKGEKRKMKIKAIVKEDTNQNATDTNPDVNTKSITTDLRGTWGTPVNADDKLHTNTDSSGNTTVPIGESPASGVMKSGDPMAHFMPGTSSNVEAKVSEPFADYADFADCVAKNSDKDDPEAYCGQIKAQTEAARLNEEDTSQPRPEDIRSGATKTKPGTFNMPDAGGLPRSVKADTILGTAPVGPGGAVVGTTPFEGMASLEERKLRIKADLKASTAEEKAQKFEGMHDDLYKQFVKYDAEHKQTLAVLEDRKATIEKLETKRDEANRDMHNAQVERDEWHSKYEHQLGVVEDLKTQIEKVRQEQSRVTEKYSATLKTNLELSQKLTKANEDYLEVAKAKEDIEEKLTAARTNAKKTLKLKI